MTSRKGLDAKMCYVLIGSGILWSSTAEGSSLGSVTIISVLAGQRTDPDWVFTSYEWSFGLVQFIGPGSHFFGA